MILSNAVVLVTGASSGLGEATARYLLQKGARVLAADVRLGNNLVEWARDERNLCQDENNAEAYPNPRLIFYQMDVTQQLQVSSALDEMEKVFGSQLTAAVNCAGIAPTRKTLSASGTHDYELFTKTLMVNTAGTFNVASLAAERMASNEPDAGGMRGCLVNTASIAGYEGQKGQVAYASSKAAVVGMTLPMARDLAETCIRVVTVAPGLFETPMLEKLPTPAVARLEESVPCPSRLGYGTEFARLVAHIIENDMLNGCTIRLDGALRLS